MLDLASLPRDVLERVDLLNLEKLKGHRFAIQIDGDLVSHPIVAGFERLRGLGDALEIREVAEGGLAGRHKFPRRPMEEPLTLMRGMGLSRSLYNWFMQVKNWTKGSPDYRRTLSIFLLDEVYIKNLGVTLPYEVWQFDVIEAWPSSWGDFNLDAETETFLMQTLIVQHSGITEAHGLFSGKLGELVSLLA